MIRFIWTAAVLAVLSSVVALSAAAGPTDPPYPSRIDFPAPSVDATGAVTTNFSPEGMAVSGNNFYAGSTQTGEIIKGNLQTGQYQRNWVPASPPRVRRTWSCSTAVALRSHRSRRMQGSSSRTIWSPG